MSHRFVSATAVAIFAVGLAACSPSSPSGPSSAPVASTAVSPAAASDQGTGREPAWSTELGTESWSNPAALGDLVVFGANDGVVRAIEAESGEVAWEITTGGQVRGGVAVADDAAYVVSDDGAVYAMDASGTVTWTTALGVPVADRGDYDNYGSTPAIGGGVVYAATQSGHVGALEAATGQLLWSVDVGAPVEAGLALGEGLLHVSTMGNRHVALSVVDGSLVWELPTGAPATTTPYVMGERVIVGSRSANVQVRDEATGDKAWSVSLGGSWVQSGAAPIDEDHFAIGSSDYKAVRAFNVASGEGLWLTKVVGWPWAIPVVADDVVYASEIRLDYQLPWDTALWALDAQTGEVLWTASGGPALEWVPDGYETYGNGASPVVVGDLVIVPGLDGVVRAFER